MKLPDIHSGFFGHCTVANFKRLMKFSLESIRISIAGAKLSHLVQKDRIWDHGSMTEQARIIFYLVQKANATGNIESLKKHCSVSCFEKLKTVTEKLKTVTKEGVSQEISFIANPVINEIAIIDAQPSKKNKPDMFCVLIRGSSKDVPLEKFTTQWSFVRQGDWWVLDQIKTKKSILNN